MKGGKCKDMRLSAHVSIATWNDTDPPNGLAFSCGERARKQLPKPNDLAREAVSCNAGLGRNHPFIASHCGTPQPFSTELATFQARRRPCKCDHCFRMHPSQVEPMRPSSRIS